MVANCLLLCGILSPIGPLSVAGQESFDLVRQMAIAKSSERERIARVLINRPDAAWAVVLGSAHRNSEVASQCVSILEFWRTQAENIRYKRIVRECDDNFDRFLNSHLFSSAAILDQFASASVAARAFDRCFVLKSFPTLATARGSAKTPFHDFSIYRQRENPVLFKGFLQPERLDSDYYLARCSGVKATGLFRSIIISDGNIDFDTCSHCLIIAGGDLSAVSMHSSMVLAAGNVALRGGTAGHNCIFAGGTLSIGSQIVGSCLVSPKKVEIAAGGRLLHGMLVADDNPKPLPELFSFVDLWHSFGLEASAQDDLVRVTKTRPTAVLARYLKNGDTILDCNKAKVSSVGQLRRLLGHAQDIQALELGIKRNEKQIRVHTDWK